ncbi:AAA family ATPase [Hydrogenimonas urashimensis]|uniref:AAA family ATPase n=1 Tax=Hydrogenimonas urashimensis TaxID=2740515 RepID=UPI001915112A|nr:ATP-binding protein [Hydrogenimonas urashimensis]
MENSNTFAPFAEKKNFRLLRSATIYGPNASGKSNLIKALDAMQDIVLFSYSKYQRGDTLPIEPFLLDAQSRHAPSEFEVMFIEGGVQYQYGFVATKERIEEEWLYAYPKKTAQKWYHRIGDKWTFGSYFRGNKKLWSESTRENSLFLSTAVNMNSEMLRPVYDWFKKKLHILSNAKEYWHPSFTYQLCEDEEHKKRVLEFLKVADMDIDDIEVEEKPFDPNEMLPDDVPEVLKKEIVDELQGKKLKTAYSIHTDLQGERVRFKVDTHESEGTKKFISFIGPWIDTLENGYVMVIDELHDNFHPLMVKFLIQLFHDNDINTRNAQLIFTSHETTVMSQDIFRRDQIWFCDKKNKATQLYSLVEFKPRKGVTDIEKAYLSGRYEALPFISIPYGLIQRDSDGPQE